LYKNQSRWFRLALILWDSLISILSIFIAGMIRFQNIADFDQATQTTELIAVVLITSSLAFFLSKMYSQFIRRGYLTGLFRVVIYNVWLTLFLTLYTFSTKNDMALSRLTFYFFLPINVILMYLSHLAIKAMVRHMAKGQSGWKTVIVTDAENVVSMIENVRSTNDWKNKNINIFMYDGKPVAPSLLDGHQWIDPATNLLDYIVKNPVDEVLFAINRDANDSGRLEQWMRDIAETGAVISLGISFPTLTFPTANKITKLGNAYVASMAAREYDYAELLCKRAMDIVGSIVGLLITLPVFLFVAPAIKIESPGPIFFKHQRVGRNGRIFNMYKFRSMYADAEAQKAKLMEKNKMKGLLFKIDNDPRITKIGRLIRKTSIDELPQFWNILKGDMSLVGTRPPTLDEYQHYTAVYKRRLSFRPGLTGIWQSSGRNAIESFQEVLEMDFDYIQNWSLGLDIKIILKTLVIVVLRKGAV